MNLYSFFYLLFNFRNLIISYNMNVLNHSTFSHSRSKKKLEEEKCSVSQTNKNLKRDLNSILNIRVVLALSHLQSDYLCKIRFF